MPGQPRTFQGQAYGQAEVIARSVRQALRWSKAPTRGGGAAVVGVSSTS